MYPTSATEGRYRGLTVGSYGHACLRWSSRSAVSAGDSGARRRPRRCRRGRRGTGPDRSAPSAAVLDDGSRSARAWARCPPNSAHRSARHRRRDAESASASSNRCLHHEDPVGPRLTAEIRRRGALDEGGVRAKAQVPARPADFAEHLAQRVQVRLGQAAQLVAATLLVEAASMLMRRALIGCIRCRKMASTSPCLVPKW